MIVGEEEEWVYLCDGRLRGVEHPKKKKKKQKSNPKKIRRTGHPGLRIFIVFLLVVTYNKTIVMT